MAFSFRIGTKWCHDFPKLARESGFYFNMHRSRVRVDWNRISNIDVNQIIRERDFHAIDDNINSVIDYCLESEYDVKILDPNFVKLFRLAQLAVEYLLYCKQYLDHSVVILKDELRLKIEENVKLKREIATLEEVVKHLKEKAKDKNKLIETKIGDCNGEIYKCPHCSKTFISSVFVSAHIIRRHAYTSDLYMTSSPVHEHYRNETEKLHNEIKTLKERLNETERVIRNESERVSDKKSIDQDRKLSENEVESFKHNVNKSAEHQEYKGYQEEIRNLKTMLFDEIHNLRQKEKTVYERTSETNVQTLINQQEKEFQKLRNQLFEKLTPDIESMHAKLYAQENYWKSKIEHLENQHHKDVERLTTELKLTQKAADDIKTEYESKVNNLERQTANQSNILIEQSKQLHSLSQEINVSVLNDKNKTPENNLQRNSEQSIMLDQSNETVKRPNESILSKAVVKDMDRILSSDLSVSKIFPLTVQHKISKNVHILNSRRKSIINKHAKSIKQRDTRIEDKNVQKDLKYNSSDTSESQDSLPKKRINHETGYISHDFNKVKDLKTDLNKVSTNELEDTFNKSISQKFLYTNDSKESEVLEDDVVSETNSESVISELQTYSETESITMINNNSPVHECKKAVQYNSFYKKLQENLQNIFEQKLRDLGIDLEWQGIPKQTFKQKMDILKHHQKIAMKKFPKYHQIKLKIIEEVLNKISEKVKVPENFKDIKKSTVIKAVGGQKSSNNYISTFQTQDTTQNTLYSTSDIENYFENINQHESTPQNLISSKDIQHKTYSQEVSTKKNSLSKMKSLFESDNGFNSNVQNLSVSPKHNKSVLKSATGSTSSLTKKKVIFDLSEEKDEESVDDSYIGKEELIDSNWHTSSISDEKKNSSVQENSKNTNNITLKTTQSNKIAEISRKLEAQLNMIRQKPVGSVETIFSSNYMQNKKDHMNDNQQTSSASSFLEGSLKTSTFNSKVISNSLPQLVTRNLKDKIPEVLRTESISEISDIDSDLDKLLKL